LRAALFAFLWLAAGLDIGGCKFEAEGFEASGPAGFEVWRASGLKVAGHGFVFRVWGLGLPACLPACLPDCLPACLPGCMAWAAACLPGSYY